MQPYRLTTRTLPRVVCKATCPSPAKRTLFTTPFFPPSPVSDLAPLFRLLDSATADLIPSTTTRGGARRAAAASFTPRFDVRELGSTYELQGELPGIEQKDLQIEFVDERTLVIRGRTSSEYSSSQDGNEATATTKAVEAGDASTAVDNAEAKTTATNYRRPSVQEEEDYVDAGKEAASDASGASAEATTKTDQNTQVAAEQSQSQSSKDVTSTTQEHPGFKYWISERSVGEFERRFSFPGRVDQDAVKASLRNGILSVVVPKVVKGEARRILIE
ncbi:hypothetical protein JMJ35_000826 [Cladonia borealis]|uniref:SHSP domain-containing protein n=1 Tax=Cladonia borealis TaxID=184061 RepID=A0AA39V4R4_9LECA|nr:hypothetical protein JMJ35_000826 [Cladonia borealis]